MRIDHPVSIFEKRRVRAACDALPNGVLFASWSDPVWRALRSGGALAGCGRARKGRARLARLFQFL